MTAQTPFPLAADAFDVLMPMHAFVRPDETISHVGPTLAKVLSGASYLDQPFSSVFELRRPDKHDLPSDVCGWAGARFSLRLRDEARTPLIGTGACLGRPAGLLMNLSFGIAVVDAVDRFTLAGSDFAATDLTLELLYLVEANAAAMAESRKLNERLQGARLAAETQAQSDSLTGLHNRRAFDRSLARSLARGDAFTLAHLDLDFFKQVNDTLGHAAGDQVLTEVARILLEVTRANDVVARVGGDEFVLILDGLTDEARLSSIGERLIRRLEEPIRCDGGTARISGSIGFAASTEYSAPEADRMMQDADRALYASKARGRACFSFHRAGEPAPGGERRRQGGPDPTLARRR